jgi:hypothetical protein
MSLEVPTRFREAYGGLVLAVGFFGGGAAYAYYELFLAPFDPARIFNPAVQPARGVAWFALVACCFMTAWALVRLTIRRVTVIFAPDHVRFGNGARRVVWRRDVVSYAAPDEHLVELFLHHPDDAEVRRAAGLWEGVDSVRLYPGELKHGEQLEAAVAAWLDAADTGRDVTPGH